MLRLQKTWIVAGILLLCLTLISGVGAKQKSTSNSGTPLSAQDKQHALQDNFVLVKTVAAMPIAVQQELVGKDIRSGMADAGKPFEVSDMVGSKPLPFRRLVFAAVSPGYCLVYNERGGAFYGTQATLYRLTDRQAVIVWRAGLHNDKIFFDLPQLRNEIVAGRYYSEQLP